MRIKEFFAFIKERHAIWKRRDGGLPKPWTKDPILQQYRFCNVYRELDTVTIWIRENWREPLQSDPNIWFAMVVARLVNWPATLYELPHAILGRKDISKIDWQPKAFIRELDALKARGRKVWTGAYMIHAGPAEGASKAAYIANEVLTPIWENRKAGCEAFSGLYLRDAHKWLMTQKDMGSFMAGQVIADVKYTPLLNDAQDWWSWAAPGPGSLRGLSRLEFGDVGTKYTVAQWSDSLREVLHKIDTLTFKHKMPRIHAQDLQNCFCEWDKYERVRLGEGRPRSLYPGGAND